MAKETRRTLSRATLLAVAVSLLLSVSAPETHADARKRILVFSSYRPDSPVSISAQKMLVNPLRQALNGQLDEYTEYVDEPRFSDPEYKTALRDFIVRKYAGQHFDLIIITQRAALGWFTTYASEFFSNTPVFFVAGNGLETSIERPRPNYTGVLYKVDLRPSLEIALRLQPGLKRIFVVTGSADFDKHYEEGAREQFREFEGRLAFTYTSGQPLEEVKLIAAHLPEDTAIFTVTMSEDRTGSRFITIDATSQIARAASVPVYTWRETELGTGSLGGSLLSFDKIFEQSAPIALRLLRGEKAEDIPVTEISPNVVAFDWRQLQRWGINEGNLPPGSQVRFKELTFWEQYKGRIIAGVTLIVLEALLITVLLIEKKRRRRAKDALDQLNAELEQRIDARTAELGAKTRELETFAYSVAHDLKAPLRGIDGYSRLLLEDHAHKLDDEGRFFLQTISTQTEEMSQLIEDLLAYSRLERRELKSERLELRPLITGVVEQKKQEIMGRDIDFVLNVNGNTVTADSFGLTQAFKNYLDNAIKFTRDVPTAKIEIGAAEDERGCRLWVRDNGVGFDMKYHDQVFEMFKRLHQDEEYAGTGIGLAIVRKAMERMGGRAWAESSPGRGATFYLEVPK